MSEVPVTVDTNSTDRPLVGVVVLTWENYEEAKECLNSLALLSYPNYHVFVVDNGSEDGSYQKLREEFPWCEFVRNERNLGVTKGNNAGIGQALDAGADYILLLNDDTVVIDGCLAALVQTAERKPDAAVVGGINYHMSTGDIHNAGARFPVPLGGLTILHDEPLDEEPYPVDYVPTCLALLDAEFVANNDVLSEAYFLGMEDVDLAWQAREAGYKVFVNPDARIYHRIGRTSSLVPFTIYHRIRNCLQFASRHLSVPERAVFLFSLSLWTVGNSLWWLARRESDKVKALIAGARDYTVNRDFRAHDDIV